MNKRIGTTVMLILATFQVACGKSKKEKLGEAMADCGQPCIDMYKRTAANTQLAGLANTAGLPQVATPGTVVQPGQVPDTVKLPASVSNAQVSAVTAKIQSQMKELDAQTASTAGPMVSTSTSVPTQVDVGVARVPSAASLANSSNQAGTERWSAGPMAAPAESSGTGAGN